MFDLVTGNKRVVQIVLAIIILPFAFFGIDSYFRGSSQAQEIANIDGEAISVNEFGQLLRNVQNGMQSQLKDNPQMQEYFNSVAFKRTVLDDLIQRRVMLKFARDNELVVTDSQITQEILAIGAFHDVDGSFSNERYVSILKAQNLTPERFENEIRQGILLQTIEDSVLGDTFVSNDLISRLETIRTQERVVSQYIFVPEDFKGDKNINDSEAREFFDNNQTEFMMPAKVKVEYVLFTPEILSDSVVITEDDIKGSYNERIEEYKTPEERQASHILLATTSDMNDAAISKIEEKIETILSKLQKAPLLFAELAREFSDDPGSAEIGGDLGFFEKGLMPLKFDEIVFNLKEGEISPIIKTEYGFHIAKLENIKPVITTPLDQVRQEIARDLKQSKLAEEFGFSSQEFGDLVYSQYDSLQPVVERFNLTLFQSDWLSEFGGSGNPILDSPKFLEAIFSESSIKEKRNIEAIEVEANQLVSARVVDYQEKSLVDYSSVKGEIVKHLEAEKAAMGVKNEGISVLGRLQSGENVTLNWSKDETVSILKRKGLHPEGLRAVFGAKINSLPSFTGIAADNGKYVIYKIKDVYSGKQIEPDKISSKARQELNNMAGQEQFKAFLGTLKKKSNITINESFFVEMAGQ